MGNSNPMSKWSKSFQDELQRHRKRHLWHREPQNKGCGTNKTECSRYVPQSTCQVGYPKESEKASPDAVRGSTTPQRHHREVSWERATLKTRFFNSVLNGIIGLEVPWICQQTLRTIKNPLGTLLGKSWRPPKVNFETGPSNKSFFALEALREIPAFAPCYCTPHPMAIAKSEQMAYQVL